MTKDELNRKLRSNQWIEGTSCNWYRKGVKIYVHEHGIVIVSKDGDKDIDYSDKSYGEIMDAINNWKNELCVKVIDTLLKSGWTVEDSKNSATKLTKNGMCVCFFSSSISVSNNLITYTCSCSDVYFTEYEVHLGDLTIDRRE